MRNTGSFRLHGLAWTVVFRSRLGFRWLLVILVLSTAAGEGAAPGSAQDPRAVKLREKGLALVTRDDTASLERAADLLDQSSRVDPRLYQARADRALVELLLAAARRDEASRIATGDVLMQSGRELRERAVEELRPLAREHAGDLAVVRALAVYYGLDGNAAQAARLAGLARAAGSPDLWIDFAELAAGLREASREMAITRLAEFAASHPDLLRARIMLARAQLDLSRTDDAVVTLDALLAANPEHDLAQQLKARILSPPPARVVAVPIPLDAPPPRPSGYLPRRRSGTSWEGAREHRAPSGAGADGAGR
jgi:predicted Zn-dependent protease